MVATRWDIVLFAAVCPTSMAHLRSLVLLFWQIALLLANRSAQIWQAFSLAGEGPHPVDPPSLLLLRRLVHSL